MRKTFSLLTFVFLIVTACGLQTASAQFPKLPKIPKPSQPKPQPTPTEPTQPTSDSSSQPESRNTTMSAATNSEVYARKPEPTDTPLFLAETLEIRTDTQDYYWKMPKESNYTSWLPHIKFNVDYGGSSRLRYKAEYFMPDGSPWYSETLEQKGTGTPYLIESEFVSDKDQGKAIVTPGTFGLKITNMKNNEVALQGKFKVIKYKPDNTDARYRNLVDFYVDQDWNLPIGYADLEDWSLGAATPLIRMWFKGGVKSEDLEARIYHNGQQLATTDDGGM